MTGKYKILIAMDCDGCYEDSMDWQRADQPGIVKRSELETLEIHGAKVTFVSDSPLCYYGWKQFGHEGNGALDDYVIDRYTNLKTARAKYPADFYLYVSDNPGDEHVAALARFTLLHPQGWKVYYSSLIAKLTNE